jgi:uncharacterized integral membrane protein
MPDQARKIIGWSLLGLLALFIVFNFQFVEINFLLIRVSLPKAFLIFISAALGGGAVWALRYLKDLRKPPAS